MSNMSGKKEQLHFWTSDESRLYINEAPQNISEYNEAWKKLYNISYYETIKAFLKSVPRSSRILDVGCGSGLWLEVLRNLGFYDLWGIEVSDRLLTARAKGFNVVRAQAQDLPFKNDYFDLIFTSSVLCHIHPQDISLVIDEIHRCTKKYILGYELFANTYTEIGWRGRKNLLWKANFSKLYTNKVCKIQKQKFIKYIENENVDTLFLLQKLKLPIKK